MNLGRILKMALLVVILGMETTEAAESFYYGGYNSDITTATNWNSFSGGTVNIAAGNDYFVDRLPYSSTTPNNSNATARFRDENILFAGNLYLGFTPTYSNGTVSYAISEYATRFCTGYSTDQTATLGDCYLGYVALNQWYNGTVTLVSSSGKFTLGDGNLEGNVMYTSCAHQGHSRNVVFDSSLAGSGTFLLANTKNDAGVTLAGENAVLGKVNWILRQGNLWVGTLEGDTGSSLGRGSTVLFDSYYDIVHQHDGSNNYANLASTSEYATDRPTLVFNTPANAISDNSTVTVSTTYRGTTTCDNVGKDNSVLVTSGTDYTTVSSLVKKGNGTAILGRTSVSLLNVQAGTMQFGNATTPATVWIDQMATIAGTLKLAENTEFYAKTLSVEGGTFDVDETALLQADSLTASSLEWTSGVLDVKNLTLTGDFTANGGSFLTKINADGIQNRLMADSIAFEGTAGILLEVDSGLDLSQLSVGESYDWMESNSPIEFSDLFRKVGNDVILSTWQNGTTYDWLLASSTGVLTFQGATPSVPEPSTWILFLSYGMGWIVWRQFRLGRISVG
ncbi:MAG: PEP-CTERM sorting domain-containing protein [Planctomycetia bacterium]|nr:PEP-CTERM sorting domain-containing protein [Planctomycetia bacterium]